MIKGSFLNAFVCYDKLKRRKIQDDDIFYNPLLEYLDETDILWNNNIFNTIYDDITKLKNNNTYSKSRIFLHLIEYAKIYEHFRPYPITQDNPYWGTVSKIEAIYFILLKYLDCDELVIAFSSNASEIFHSYHYTKKREHTEIDWDEILDDINYISNAIMCTIGLNAIRAYYIIGHNSSYIIKTMVKKFITDSFLIDENSIELIKNEIHIDGKKVIAKNEHILIRWLLELKYERKLKSV
ncbi:MAG: hypothetical protein LBP54_07565 [Campylobacteraceae bacterium]|nr:hypothetical protein [Campylobacteraceae bacterium]